MANVQGWAKLTHRAKMIEAKLSSHGYGWQSYAVMSPPEFLNMTLERSDGQQLDLQFTPQEVLTLSATINDFLARRTQQQPATP